MTKFCFIRVFGLLPLLVLGGCSGPQQKAPPAGKLSSAQVGAATKAILDSPMTPEQKTGALKSINSQAHIEPLTPQQSQAAAKAIAQSPMTPEQKAGALRAQKNQ